MRSSGVPFYRDLLGPLGFHRVGEVEGEAVFFYDPDGIKLEIVHVPGLAA